MPIKISELTDAKTSEVVEDSPVDQARKDSRPTPDLSTCAKKSKTQTKSDPSADRKFNVVVFGVAECKSETTHVEHLANDSSSILGIFQKLNSNLNESTIHDCFCLGRYNQSHKWPGPILVKLNRSIGVANTLSNRSLCPENITVKPDLTSKEREIVSILLKKVVSDSVRCKS